MFFVYLIDGYCRLGLMSRKVVINEGKFIIFLQNRQMQCSKNLHKTQQLKKIAHTNTSQTNQITYLMQSIQRDKYSNTTNINLNMSIDKENKHNNQGRYSIKMNPTQHERTSGNVMVRSSFLQKGVLMDLERSKERDRDGGKVRVGVEEKMDKIVQSLVYKLKKYLAITEAMLQVPTRIEQKLRKQAINTACQLVEVINNLEQVHRRKKQQSAYSSLNSTGNLVLGENKSLSSSYHFPNQLQLNSSLSPPEGSMNFIRKIQNLQQQKNQLESIISQNQREKIKMIIKIREGQSEQIQKYKRQLSSLFEKYKQLQKLVKKQSEKSKNLQLIIDQFKNKKQCGKLCELNIQQMRKKIIGFEEVVYEQNQYLSKALEEISALKQQITIYEKMQAQYAEVLMGLQKKQKAKPSVKSHENKNIDYSKSTCSSEFGFETHHNKYQANIHNTELSQTFANITLKSPQHDQSLLRMMFAQASLIDTLCIRK